MGNLAHIGRLSLQLYFTQKIVVRAASGGWLANSRANGHAQKHITECRGMIPISDTLYAKRAETERSQTLVQKKLNDTSRT